MTKQLEKTLNNQKLNLEMISRFFAPIALFVSCCAVGSYCDKARELGSFESANKYISGSFKLAMETMPVIHPGFYNLIEGKK